MVSAMRSNVLAGINSCFSYELQRFERLRHANDEIHVFLVRLYQSHYTGSTVYLVASSTYGGPVKKYPKLGGVIVP